VSKSPLFQPVSVRLGHTGKSALESAEQHVEKVEATAVMVVLWGVDEGTIVRPGDPPDKILGSLLSEVLAAQPQNWQRTHRQATERVALKNIANRSPGRRRPIAPLGPVLYSKLASRRSGRPVFVQPFPVIAATDLAVGVG
jgi:hypothetical protein